jgi:methyltransferase-like protein 6
MTLCDTLPLQGTLCFRDFAHGDLSQVRFHQKASAAWCEPNLLSPDQDFYRRGDNTFTYFFAAEEIDDLAKSVGLEGVVEIKETHGLNRKTGVRLHRRFLQGRWKKVR